MAAIAFGFGIFTGALMLYHSMLIMTGKTTWEHTKRDKISYLNYYPKFYHPYDFGILKNI
jgi:palmitoyltransferase